VCPSVDAPHAAQVDTSIRTNDMGTVPGTCGPPDDGGTPRDLRHVGRPLGRWSSAASGNVCPADDAAEPLVVGVVVAPDDVAADHAGLLVVVVGAVEGEVAQRGELGFDPVNQEAPTGCRRSPRCSPAPRCRPGRVWR
jgi:hypothetical protein